MTTNIENIRNISIIAHVDHGKSTLSDTFLMMSGLISEDDAGKKRATDTRPDEKERGITIKSTGVSLDLPYNDSIYHVNLIDSPGHCDFSGEVSAAIRVTDGAVVVVDSVEGVCVQTRTVLQQALAEKVIPILVINKFDRYFFELNLSAEAAYNKIQIILAEVNALIRTFMGDIDEKYLLNPENNNVIFSSALHKWGFGLNTWAKFYANKYNKSVDDITGMLWGENYYDTETNKIVTINKQNKNKKKKKNQKKKKNLTDKNSQVDKKTSDKEKSDKEKSDKKTSDKKIRTFEYFVFEPMRKLIELIMDPLKKSELALKLEENNIKLSEPQKQLTGRDLYKVVFPKFLPLTTVLMSSVVNHLPNPIDAQKNRASVLYSGPIDMKDSIYKDIHDCNPNGNLVIYISKMIPTGEGGKFYAFGRIFAGTIKAGQKVIVMDSNYDPENPDSLKKDVYFDKPILHVYKMIGAKPSSVSEAQAGEIIALVGVDAFLTKSGTIVSLGDQITSLKEFKFYPIKTMKFKVKPVVSLAVSVKDASYIGKLNEGIKKLSKADVTVHCYQSSEGEHIIAGVGELHLQICINDLKQFLGSVDITVSNPIVPFKETVTEKSQLCLAKSPNGHNRLWVYAEPLDEKLVDDIENNVIEPNSKTISKTLVKYGWAASDTKKIWKICNTNILVDMTKGIQYLDEIKNSVNSSFDVVCSKGVLCGEQLRGVRFNIVDVKLHADAIHRGMGQILPTAERVFRAAQFTGKPRIVEPFYQIDITAPPSVVDKVYSSIIHKRGSIDHQENGVPLVNLKGYLPVLESFNIDSFLKEKTSGQAFLQMTPDKWEIVDSDALIDGSKANELVMDVRKRKGMKIELPKVSDLVDKL